MEVVRALAWLRENSEVELCQEIVIYGNLQLMRSVTISAVQRTKKKAYANPLSEAGDNLLAFDFTSEKKVDLLFYQS